MSKLLTQADLKKKLTTRPHMQQSKQLWVETKLQTSWNSGQANQRLHLHKWESCRLQVYLRRSDLVQVILLITEYSKRICLLWKRPQWKERVFFKFLATVLP